MVHLPVRYTSIREETIVGARGALTPVIRVEYTIGDHGPFVERIPRSEYSPITLRQKVAEMARSIEETVRE